MRQYHVNGKRLAYVHDTTSSSTKCLHGNDVVFDRDNATSTYVVHVMTIDLSTMSSQCRHATRSLLRRDSACPREATSTTPLRHHVDDAMTMLSLKTMKFFQHGAGRHLGFVQTVNSAVRSAVPENRTLEPNMK